MSQPWGALHEVHSSHGFKGTVVAQAGPPGATAGVSLVVLLWLHVVNEILTASHAAGHAARHMVKCTEVGQGCRACLLSLNAVHGSVWPNRLLSDMLPAMKS